MEQLILYIPAGLLVFILGSIVTTRVSLSKRPTYKDTDERYRKIETCDEIVKGFKDDIKCLPEIKETVIRMETKLDIWMKNNGKGN